MRRGHRLFALRALPLLAASACRHQPRHGGAPASAPPHGKLTIVTPPLAVARVDITGAWDSPEWGTLRLVHKGRRVFGDHDWGGGGQIDGRIEDDGTLHFYWWQGVALGQPYSAADPSNRGDGRFTIAHGGSGLDGTWRYEREFDHPPTGTWTARNRSALPESYRYTPPPFGTPPVAAFH